MFRGACVRGKRTSRIRVRVRTRALGPVPPRSTVEPQAPTGHTREPITEADVHRALEFLESALVYLHDVRPPWMALAECRGVDTAIFFPRRGELTDALDYCKR